MKFWIDKFNFIVYNPKCKEVKDRPKNQKGNHMKVSEYNAYRLPTGEKGFCRIIAEVGEFYKVFDLDSRAILYFRREWVKIDP